MAGVILNTWYIKVRWIAAVPLGFSSTWVSSMMRIIECLVDGLKVVFNIYVWPSDAIAVKILNPSWVYSSLLGGSGPSSFMIDDLPDAFVPNIICAIVVGV